MNNLENKNEKLLLEVDNIQEALKIASQKFGLQESELETKIISEAKKGFLGLFSKKMQVEVSAKKIEQETQKTQTEQQIPESKPKRRDFNRKNSAGNAKKFNKPEKIEQPEKFERIEKSEKSEKLDNENYSESEKITFNTDNTQLLEKSSDFLNNVLKMMNFSAEAEISESKIIEITGEDASDYVVGHYGDALKALEYLVNLALRDPKKEPRVRLDSCGYRERRIRNLERLAEATARQAVRFGRPVRLEPMASWERWVIHTTLKNRDDVSTESIGEPPLRKVVIMPKINESRRSNAGGRNFSRNNKGRFNRDFKERKGRRNYYNR